MSSLVTAPERSVIGKITRSGLDTRKSRPPASTIIAPDAATPGVLRHRRPRTPPRLRRRFPPLGPRPEFYGIDARAHPPPHRSCSSDFAGLAWISGLERPPAAGRGKRGGMPAGGCPTTPATFP